VGPNDDYVWGKPVRINQVAPDDVLQFRNWIVTTKTEIAVHFADGTGYRDTDEVVARRPHHTAIVKHVGGGGILQVYEQHVKPLGNRVQLHDVPTRGSPAIAKLTHKLMKDETGKMRMATVNTVTTIVVSGVGLGVSPAGKVASVGRRAVDLAAALLTVPRSLSYALSRCRPQRANRRRAAAKPAESGGTPWQVGGNGE
jgi:hypothetical protein